MNGYNGYNKYQQNQVATASPEQILLMLYDGAIRFTKIAIAGIEEKKPEEKMRGISKALAIISEFSNSLNHDIGGKIAEDLDALYGFMIRELSSANLSNDIEKIRTVQKLLLELRETWGEAVEIQKRENAVQTPAAADQKEYRPFAISR